MCLSGARGGRIHGKTAMRPFAKLLWTVVIRGEMTFWHCYSDSTTKTNSIQHREINNMRLREIK